MAASPPLHTLSATTIARRIRDGSLTSTAITDALLDRITTRNDRTNAFVTVTADLARDAAAQADAARDAGDPLGPLHGVPVAIKDLDNVEGVKTTSGSLLFEDQIADENDLFVDRLLAAGAIIVGKTNTPEFGLGCTTHNRVVGPTGNPFNPEYIAGGSSGGAAAALGDQLVPIAQGSDTGGSIRTPASCCGVFGLKPSFGRIPSIGRPNAFGHHTPFSHLGPMARTVEDAALMLDVMAGPDPRDPFSLPAYHGSFQAAVQTPLDDYSIAFSPDLGVYPVDSVVREVTADAVTAFEGTEAELDEADPPLSLTNDDILEAYYRFARVLWESLFDGLGDEYDLDPRGDDRDKLADSTVETILDADTVTTREYKAADRVRTQVYDAITDLLETYDILLTPTLAVPPFEIDAFPTEIAGQAIDPRRGWLLTQPFNMTGHPVASVPAGVSPDGLPIGLQIIGPRFGDAAVLAASAAFERHRPWHDTYPT